MRAAPSSCGERSRAARSASSSSRLRAFAIGSLIAFAPACHDGDEGASAQLEMVRHWSSTALDASGLDHEPAHMGPPHVFGEQLGPCRSARAMAIVHLALFEATNAVGRRYESYVGLAPAGPDTSLRAAIAYAAHDALAALYPSQAPLFADRLVEDLAHESPSPARERGAELGRAAAKAVLDLRANDGSDHAEPRVGIDYVPSDLPGRWRPDPVSEHPLALGALWPQVRPFVMSAADAFRAPPPPDMASAEYALAFDEAKQFGGDGATTPTLRTLEQERIGIYWAYDGTPSLCAPPRLYNQIAMQLALERGFDAFELARLLALVDVALADAAIAVWDSKYNYEFWRPITGIREADPGSGPTGAGDGNAATLGDPAYMPLGAPASNDVGPNFTPPFPAYPSGHAGFGGALFQVLRRAFGTDAIAFTFVSDELNGVTVDNQGAVRPLAPRSFSTLSQAEEENGQSRIYLGIHWAFDKTAGIAQGRAVADLVFDSILRPLP